MQLRIVITARNSKSVSNMMFHVSVSVLPLNNWQWTDGNQSLLLLGSWILVKRGIVSMIMNYFVQFCLLYFLKTICTVNKLKPS